MSKVFQVPVSSVLALLKEGETRYFLCYNVAVLLVPEFEQHFYDKWAQFKEVKFEYEDMQSGYYAYSFVQFYLNSKEFEETMFSDNITKWVEKHFGEPKVNDINGLNYMAIKFSMEPREFRILLLEKVLSDNPDAMFHVKI